MRFYDNCRFTYLQWKNIFVRKKYKIEVVVQFTKLMKWTETKWNAAAK